MTTALVVAGCAQTTITPTPSASEAATPAPSA